jgi:hypothetical protein
MSYPNKTNLNRRGKDLASVAHECNKMRVAGQKEKRILVLLLSQAYFNLLLDKVSRFDLCPQVFYPSDVISHGFQRPDGKLIRTQTVTRRRIVKTEKTKG